MITTKSSAGDSTCAGTEQAEHGDSGLHWSSWALWKGISIGTGQDLSFG